MLETVVKKTSIAYQYFQRVKNRVKKLGRLNNSKPKSLEKKTKFAKNL